MSVNLPESCPSWTGRSDSRATRDCNSSARVRRGGEPGPVSAWRNTQAAPEQSTYARVDLVPSASGPLRMELELMEPDLGLRLMNHGAVAFAEVCLALL